MKRVDGIVGNINSDPALASAIADHEQADTLETVVLDETERKRSRIRVTTDVGTDLGVLVDRPELTPGDILILNNSRAVVVAFEPREAFVIDFSTSQLAVSTAINLGHRIGNQHWDIAIDNELVYIPVEADHAIIEEVLEAYIPADATTYYETVDAERFLNDNNKMNTTEHSSVDNHTQTDHDETAHYHGRGHGHGHDDDHDHAHNHNHEHTHEQTDHDNTDTDDTHARADAHDDDSKSDSDSVSAGSLGEGT